MGVGNPIPVFAFFGLPNKMTCNGLYCMYEVRCSVHLVALLGSSVSPSIALVHIACSRHLTFNRDNFVKLFWEFNAQLFTINDGLTICTDKAVLLYGIKARNDLKGYTLFGIKPMILLIKEKVFDTSEQYC